MMRFVLQMSGILPMMTEMKWLFWGVSMAVLAAGSFFFMRAPSHVINLASDSPSVELPSVPEAPADGDLLAATVKTNSDLPNQKPLANPPAVIKAVYATSWTAGSAAKTDYLISLIKETELNAVVIDIKDYSGAIAYDIKNNLVDAYKTKEVRIPKINALIKKFHDNGIYAIARITVFQDPLLAAARPDLAVRDSSTGGAWRDDKGLAWIDPTAKDAWEYIAVVARDAADRGFDELNFDYIRFPSDGNLATMTFAGFDPAVSLRSTAMREFFTYLRGQLLGVPISIDLFGLVTVNRNDLGIGQVLEDALAHFDFVAPMAYPSHYATGFLTYQNPARHPYEVVRYSIETAIGRLREMANPKPAPSADTSTPQNPAGQSTSTPPFVGKLRPWLQDFDLGADYTSDLVRAQIQAVIDAGRGCGGSTVVNPYFDSSPLIGNTVCADATSTDAYADAMPGFMLWNPANIYTKGALRAE